MHRLLAFWVAGCISFFHPTASNANETFTRVVTDCALKYEVEIGRNEQDAIDKVAGSVSLDLVAFLLIFPEEDRSKVALAWLECLIPGFEPAANGGGINPSVQTEGLTWDFVNERRGGVVLGVVNVIASGRGVDINWRVKNDSVDPLYLKFGGSSYIDSTGNICQKGSFTTGVSGFPFRRSEEPILLPRGDTRQFQSYNVRCDGTNFSNRGKVLAVMLVGDEVSSLTQFTYELSPVRTITN